MNRPHLIIERLIFFSEKLAVWPLFTSVTGIRFLDTGRVIVSQCW
jgi:hypothetical protein